jgi:fibronectin-binding autotransporter adhesin
MAGNRGLSALVASTPQPRLPDVRNPAASSRWLASLLAAALAWMHQPASVRGAAYYWDTNGPASGLGSAASPTDWLTASWATVASGTAPTVAWPNVLVANADEAVFSGTAGTVTIGGDVYANAVRFTTANYAVSSTGGALRLSGANPKIYASLPSSNNTVTISAPILADGGVTIEGNSLSGGLKFLVLANASEPTPNAFAGPLDVAAGGALRIGGGAAREQIPDNADLNVAGVIDFITSGGASDGKQEKVRNVTVTGAGAIFSVGNGTNFVVNSLVGESAETISVNGNAASVPGKLSITGWASGAGNLTLNASKVKLNTTSATGAIGGRVVLSGNLVSTGASQVINNNGAAASVNANIFANKAFDFAGTAQTVHVADGTLTFTSASASHPLQVTTLDPSGATITKTGAGAWVLEHAVETAFVGDHVVAEGTLRIGASERLADGSSLSLAGGSFDVQQFTETVAQVRLDGGAILGAGALRSINEFDLRRGSVAARLIGSAGVLKTTDGTVQLDNLNAYTGATKVAAGTLRILQPALGAGGDVFLSGSGRLELALGGAVEVPVRALFVNGTAMAPGVYGAMDSGLANATPYIVGPGRLRVDQLGLAGDFNMNGSVNDADLERWRGDYGLNGDSDADGDGDSDGFDWILWQRNVGQTAPTSAAAPEPRAAALGLTGLIATIAGPRGRRRPRGGM